ncbi:nucleotidyltransferase domain-containing protein [Metallumcola ferriviriculae]|uniref:Nucleotidyltransferase domain-containing protein n=1 Tax=Metallumcola ferriviriculae TaxID=3039180 RepID=A0AAU0UII7_9FIRM|nr:nucleotidyltransferase domain-containing protein [Desulfitibacteraceae bacterium MK1]
MNISAAYVYGSYIRGNFDEDSDIDIAVVSDEFTGDVIDDRFRLMKFRRKVDIRIEPHPFSLIDFNDNPLSKGILQDGVKLK